MNYILTLNLNILCLWVETRESSNLQTISNRLVYMHTQQVGVLYDHKLHSHLSCSDSHTVGATQHQCCWQTQRERSHLATRRQYISVMTNISILLCTTASNGDNSHYNHMMYYHFIARNYVGHPAHFCWYCMSSRADIAHCQAGIVCKISVLASFIVYQAILLKEKSFLGWLGLWQVKSQYKQTMLR